MASLSKELENARADRAHVEGLMAFSTKKMAEISSQLFAGLSGPFKYLESNPDAAGIDKRAEQMREYVADFQAIILEKLKEIANEIPDDDTICDLHDGRERESYRTFKYAAE